MVKNITVQAQAKINLFLHLTGKRKDGYHLLDSLVVFAGCGDVLEVEEADNISLEIVGKYSAALADAHQEKNLVWKAAVALRKYSVNNQGARIRLIKNLPVASGIGGGSADAAAAIRALRVLWKLDIPERELSEIALGLGSDVPVCLYGKPALIRGVGEEVIPVTLREKAYMVLVNPNIPLATAEIFQSFNFSGKAHRTLAEDIVSLEEITDGRGYGNDLEPAAINKLPVIREMLAALRTTEACFLARMSGSGATCFGLYHDKETARNAARELQILYPLAWCEATHVS